MLASSACAEARPPARLHSSFSPTVENLLALAPDGCRWPSGEADRNGVGFCGRRRLPRSSYCAAHRALACEPVR